MAITHVIWQADWANTFTKRFIIPIAASLTLVSVAMTAMAQTSAPSGLEDLPSPVEPSLPSPETLDPEPLPPEVPLQVEPSGESADITNLAVCPSLSTTSEPSFIFSDIEVLGSTVLTEEIAVQVECFRNQPLTLTDLLILRSRITQLYVNAGYITSGAFLPNNQDLSDGTVQIQMVEGQIEEIQINGLSRLRTGYVRDRIARATQIPLNQQNLEEGLQLLQLDPLLDQVDAELASGSSPGLSSLILDVQEANAFDIAFAADNYRAPSIGSEEGTISAGYTNILGLGDRLSGAFSFSEGLDLFDVSYEVPVNAKNGTVRARFNNSDSRIVEDPFDDIDIRSDTTTASVGFRQPLWQSPAEEFALGLDFDWRRSRSFILDDVPFSFSVGPEDGKSQVSVLRFYQDWVKRDDKRVLAARSQFSLGLDLFDATVNDSGTDGRFFAWQGQFQWVEQLSPRLLMLGRVNGQLTPDSLLPIERFSVGGIGTVRGYTQNEVVADNALTGSLELRVPISGDPNVLQLTPFIEAGTGWNNRTADPDPSFLLGTGLGLRWQVSPELFVRLDYGIPLVNDNNSNDSLQESGVYFLFSFQPDYL